ncbi:MAG: Pvc16 family protein, partial [Candidatus Competibacteraceae bacterium]|nr:Pvc16 family protein [Candidatus Competibacteraceae bacterium]
MADFRAIAAVSEAVIYQLRSHMRPADFGEFLDPQLQLDFRVFTSRDYANSPITNGVSLFLYRIVPNGVRRTPPGRIGPDGRRQQTQLPVEMHFLLTVWAGEASLQHALAGWMMRVMEDSSLLPSSILGTVA